MPQFRKRPETVSAVRFTDAEHPPEGVNGTRDRGFQVNCIAIAVGDCVRWNGFFWEGVNDADFRRLYEPADAPGTDAARGL